MKRKAKKLLFAGALFITMFLTSACGKGGGGNPEESGSAQTGQTEAAADSGEDEKGDTPAKIQQVPEKTEAASQPAAEEASGFPQQMPEFTTEDLDGNPVTQDLFGEKDLTVVNIWGTFCSPCIGEMPELAAWDEELPDNVQLVGLICDIQGDEDVKGRELAAAIVEKAGVGFPQLIANEDFAPLMQWVVGVPTTIFVDKDGKLVGEPIVGAYVEGYRSFVEDYLK